MNSLVVVVMSRCCCSSDLLSTLEYRSLLQLLCPDFPAEVVQNTARSDFY